MADFNVEKYRAELSKLAEYVREMNEAVNNMHYECGPAGVSIEAPEYLGQFLTAFKDAKKQQAEVAIAMVSGLPEVKQK